MNRLQTQLQRLYGSTDTDTVRTLVLGLRHPADWNTLAQVWRGVQTDWDWPAPAIAINGADAFELWFSLAQPVPAADATTMMQHLCQRYLPDIRPERLLCWPALHAASALPPPQTARIPGLHAQTGRWSAFVAADLPSVFEDEPSLDFPPGEDAQAELLARLSPLSPAHWQTALSSMQALPPLPSSTHTSTPQPQPTTAAVAHHSGLHGPYDNPRQFLRDVMNDNSIPLALRIQAAQALLD